jgi:hypothetical protein
MVVVETGGGVTTRVRSLPLILTSLGSKSGTPFYPNHRNRVNPILTHFLRLPTPRGIGCRETIAQRDATACTPSGAKSSVTDPHHLSPIAKNVALAKIATAVAEVLDAALPRVQTSV